MEIIFSSKFYESGIFNVFKHYDGSLGFQIKEATGLDMGPGETTDIVLDPHETKELLFALNNNFSE